MHPDHTTPISPIKTCSKCRVAQPATTEFFGRDKTRKDGLDPQCKACARAYYAANKEKIKARAAAWYAANPERAKERERIRREAHKEENNVRAAARYAANPEGTKARARAYYVANKEEAKRRVAAYREANLERIKEAGRAWKAANPLAVRATNQKRRARKRTAEGTHTAADIERQYEAQRGRCYYCHEKVGDTYHVDHLVPLSRGGSNWPDNLVIACPHCNTAKHNKLPHEFAQGGRLL